MWEVQYMNVKDVSSYTIVIDVGTDKVITRLICIELQRTLSKSQNHRDRLSIKLKTSCAQSNEFL